MSTTHHLSRRSFVAAAGAATALGLAACSGGEGSSEKQDTASLTPITFCLDYTPNTNHTGIYVAQALGYFAEEGLEVSIVQPAEDGAEAMVGTGQAQLGVSYQDYLANAFVGGNTGLQAVAAIIQHNTSGIMSPAELGVTRPRRMEGLRYATWELPVEQATVRQVVEKDGGDFSKLQLVPYTVDDEVAGFQADLFDTVWVFEGWAVQNAHVQGVDVNYFSFISIDDVFDFYTPVIAANNDFCAQNPDVVRAFLRAARRGYEFAVADPDAAAEILCAAVPELDVELVHQSVAFLAEQYVADADYWGQIEDGRWSAFYQWLNDNDLVVTPLDVHAGWTMDYLEPGE
jgi:ABC-type nitrate/sulfonate/bicarbonate transport system substrate-binding protein